MADERSPADIEREIEVERAQLAGSLDALTDKFSVDNMVRTVSDQMTEHGGEVAGNFMRTVKSNPVAAGLAGIGIAWLMASSGRQSSDTDRIAARDTYRPVDEPGPYVRSDYDRQSEFGRTSDSAQAGAGFDAGGSSDGGGDDDVIPAPAYARGGRPTATGFADTYPAGDFKSRVSTADERMRARSSSAADWSNDDDEGEGFLSRAGDRAGSIWDSAVDTVRGGAQGLMARASDLRDSIMEGTEGMDEHGQGRVAQARARAYAAQARAEEMGRSARSSAGGFFYEQPLVTGGLALALGAAVGAMLPRTQREDEAFGAYRDQLFDDAEQVFHQERERAEGAATAALREAKQVAVEAKDTVMSGTDGGEAANQAESAARSAVKRVSDAAKEGAKST